MSGYTQRLRDSILPHSVADTLRAAFAEWGFTESTVDHESPTETCELCGQQDLRLPSARRGCIQQSPGRTSMQDERIRP